jgi:transcriptional regulator GlxA family with amidase domain
VPREARRIAREPLRVSLLVLPDAAVGTLTGMFDTFSSLPLLGTFDDSLPREPPFAVELVGTTSGTVSTASGLPLPVHRSVADPGSTDIAIVPSLLVAGATWHRGRYPELVDWLQRVHASGAVVCSACSGVLLLAETGPLSGREATMHPAYAGTFRRNYPDVRLRLEQTLVATGDRDELVMAGASASWHDLVLYLVARHVGPTAAQDAQQWLETSHAVAAPVAELVARSGLPERTFKRRFAKATEYSPIAYVQHVRVEAAKRRLERKS